ncbi:MAG TPA: hypothetical protein VHB21_22980 [Minicystis sp.]|nr:hypothetical protein [Minicystis sp.]
MKPRVALLGAVALAGCAAAPPDVASSTWTSRSSGQKNVSSGSAAEAFFPLVDGNVYLYATMNELGEQGVLVARVHRDDAQHGTLNYGGGASKRFTYAPDGVVYDSKLGPAYILKTPLVPGTTWRGEHGGQTKILSVTADAETPAGKFTGCVQTLEERLGDAPVRYATTFCPTVGIVMLEAATGANLERAELKSYGEPRDFGPEGTTKFKVDPNAPPAPLPVPR